MRLKTLWGVVGHAGCVERVCSKRAEAELSVWRVALWMWCGGGTTYRRVSRANDWGTTRWNAGRLIARASWGSRATRRESTSRVSFDRRRHATRTHLQQAGTTGNTNSVSEEPNGTEQHPRRTHMVLETLAHGRRDRVDSTHASSRAGPPPSRGSLGTSARAGLVESARPAAADAPPRRARLPQLQRRTERHASIGCA